MKNNIITLNQQLMKKRYLLMMLALIGCLNFSFTSSSVIPNIYDSKEIIDKENLSMEQQYELKIEVGSFLQQKKRTTDLSELEVINWEIFRRGYKQFLSKEINRYIQQQVELKMIRDGLVVGEMEDELIKSPYKL